MEFTLGINIFKKILKNAKKVGRGLLLLYLYNKLFIPHCWE